MDSRFPVDADRHKNVLIKNGVISYLDDADLPGLLRGIVAYIK